jgi:hypothetical protein
MLTDIFIGLVALSTFVAFSNWRIATFMALVVGLLQDPVRKLTPEAPSLFVLSTLPIWFAIFVKMFGTEQRFIALFSMIYLKLVTRMRMFVLMLIPGGIVMLMRGFFLWKVVLLGAFGYIAPMLGIILGFVFSQNTKYLLRFLTFYCILVALVLSGTLMEYLDIFPDWNAIGTRAMKMVWIKYVSFGHTISLKAGFFRSPDIMGWHGSMMTMLSLTLFFVNRSRPIGWVWLLFAVWGVICVVISGRYKMIATIMVWGMSFTILVYLYQGIGRVIGIAVIGVTVIVGMLMVSDKVGLGGSDYMLYARSPGSYSVGRVEGHGINGVIGTYRQLGFWGNGLGSATQGVRYTGVKFKKGWQEGGPAKIMGELGVCGLVFFVLLCISLLIALISNIRGGLYKGGMFDLRAGLISIIIANAVAFIVSAQIFSDLFVLSIISMCVGFVLSGKGLSESKV